ncbi:hypothetical protein MBOT_38020 [Mycobacterium botniense]|uniref:Uncharacterized protein n=1 Tax=Mycobacterium botniense TaxID=84962 RepID=A0A7I9Y370_9MYCO|nr:hypothetical protein MBOT_38020 [Mycobacterium botniense]
MQLTVSGNNTQADLSGDDAGGFRWVTAESTVLRSRQSAVPSSSGSPAYILARVTCRCCGCGRRTGDALSPCGTCRSHWSCPMPDPIAGWF